MKDKLAVAVAVWVVGLGVAATTQNRPPSTAGPAATARQP